MYPAILTIVIVGMLLGVGIFVLVELREGIAIQYTGTDNDAVLNGTTTWLNTTTLSDASKDDYLLLSVDSVTVFNGTSTTTATSPSHYNVSETTGVITWAPNLVADYNLGWANISSTYIYDRANTPEEAVNDTMEGLGDFSAWVAIIIVVIAAAIVLGVVLGSFGRSPRV